MKYQAILESFIDLKSSAWLFAVSQDSKLWVRDTVTISGPAWRLLVAGNLQNVICSFEDFRRSLVYDWFSLRALAVASLFIFVYWIRIRLKWSEEQLI